MNGISATVIIERFATVSSDGYATIETTAASDNFHLRTIGEVRHSNTVGAAVDLGGDNNTIEVAAQTSGSVKAVGVIHSQNIGIWTNGNNPGSTTKIINDGYIVARWIAIQNDGTEQISITNRGSISGSYAAGNGVYVDFGGAKDMIINHGTMSGRIILGRGHDFFDGRTGGAVQALEGGDDHDTLYGSAFADIINGDHGEDLLNGFAGNDTLSGGTFNDTLIGGLGSDYLYGDGNNDKLNGGVGIDRLWGGANADTFIFNAAPTYANRDLIYDFSRADDTIHLDNAVFKQIGSLGVLKSTAFKLSTLVKDADDRIIYNRGTGQLFYDSDGSGAAGAVHFATLTTKPIIAYDDFRVI